MTEQEPELTLAAGFPAATRSQWQLLVARVLGRADDPGDAPERELATVTADGIDIAPLYVADADRPDPGYPGQAPFVRGRTAAGHRAGWDVRQHHLHPDPAAAREQIMEDLGGGVSSLWLGLRDGQIPVAALPDLLAEVYLDLVGIVLDAGSQFTEAAEAFLSVAARRGVPAAALTGCLGADPLGVLARTGAEAEAESGLAAAATLAGRCSAELPAMRAIVVDALPFHEAGGTDAQELGCALAAGTEYLRAMRAAGLSGAAAAGQLEFRYAATADQFATIAKLRAARRIWTRVIQQCGIPVSAGGQRQHAVTSWPMLTRRDPWNNILRETIACFAASAGGADAVTVTPFDAVIGQSDRLARRVARNIQAVLAEEAQVARVIDPAGGSWYVEDLTEQLALRAWACFQDIERAGGLRAALASGLVAGQLAASREARRSALARRRDAITGVTEFPLVGEVLLDRPPYPESGPSGGLPRIRWAQWHEELRDRADARTRATGTPPAVTLALPGASRESAAQAARVAAVLAAAGIAAVAVDSAAAEHARAGGAVVIAADEVVTDDLDTLAFGRQVLASLEVP